MSQMTKIINLSMAGEVSLRYKSEYDYHHKDQSSITARVYFDRLQPVSTSSWAYFTQGPI